MRRAVGLACALAASATLNVTMPATAASGSIAVFEVGSSHRTATGAYPDTGDRVHLYPVGVYVP